MRKVIKILAKVVSVIVLLSIFLPISITLVLIIEEVQNIAVRRATQFASEYLGTTVSIDRIDIDLFSRVRVDGFYVEDHEQDTLLYVSRATAALKSLNIREDGLLIRWAKAEDGVFNLREMQDGELNIRPIVRSLQKPNSKNNFYMLIEEIEAVNLGFRYERLTHRNPEYGVDYFNLDISNVNGQVRNLIVDRGKVLIDVAGITARERSGFELENVTTRLCVDVGELRFENFTAQTTSSDINVPLLVLKGKDWVDFQDYINKVNMSGVIADSSITTYDLGFFAPGLKDWNTRLQNVDATFDGTVRDLSGDITNANIANLSSARGKFRITGLPEWRTS